MPDLFGKKQLGRATTGGRFYATPTERVEAGAVYFPDESSLLFGVAEYTVEAGNLGAFATEGTFVFDKPSEWIDAVGRKVFFRPSTGEIVNQDKKGDVLIGFQVLANVPDDKLGVVLTQGEISVVIIVTSTADSGAGSLRQAIADARGGDVILFDSTVFPTGTTTAILLSSTLNVPKNIEIDGDGRVALDGQSAIRVCSPTASNGTAASLKGLTIKNGAYANGAGVLLQYGAPILTGCIIEDCNATSAGGGVYFTGSVIATLNNCTIRNCTAGAHGGGGYFSNTSQGTLNDCVITNCTANTNGGGLAVGSGSSCALNRCSVTGCVATGNGGAAYIYGSASVTFVECTASGNTSDNSQRSGIVALNTTSISVGASSFETLYVGPTAAATISDGISAVGTLALSSTTSDAPTITFLDGAALAVTTGAEIPSGVTFTSAGRAYLATATGLDFSAATLNNVVACTYGAGLTSFEIDAEGASWTADDLTTPILIEQRESDATWTTLSDDATGGTYSDSFDVGTTARAFDGVRFFVASLDAYWQVNASVASNANGGGGTGSASPSWTVENKTITPNVEG